MKNILIKLKNFMCYCGLEKEEYRDIKKEAYVNNFYSWRYLHILMLFSFTALTVVTISIQGFSPVLIFRAIMVIYSAFMTILFFFVLKDDSLAAQLLIYLSMILMMVSALIVSVNMEDAPSVTFIAVLVLLPVFMIDKPYFMAILLSVSVAVYLCVASHYKSPLALQADIIYSILFAFIGIIINAFYCRIRVHEFTLQKQEKDLIEKQVTDAGETARLNKILKRISGSVIDLLCDVVEERDLECGNHINRVKGFTNILANQVMNDLPEYGLDSYTVELITFTSSLHDVGKISIPDSILNKPGKLTAEEFDIMKKHCENGVSIIRKMEGKWSWEYLNMGIDICLYHHEKWDGRGYPYGLKGDEIPIAAQIVSIADIFDALTSKRSYKDAFSADRAFEMILNGECGAFSDKLLACFTKCRDSFENYVKNPSCVHFAEREFELVSEKNPEESFVIGLYDQNHTLRDKLRLHEEVSILQSLSEKLFYVCYVNTVTNEVIRYRADPRISSMVDTFNPDLPSYERFDLLLNSIIVSEDYAGFRETTDRDSALCELQELGHVTTDFRIRLEDGVHYCRMRISPDPGNPDAVIVGMSSRDEEHELEKKYLTVREQLEIVQREAENREKLAERLAVIDCLSSDYDFVCALNADNMEIVVYRAVDWIKDMFKNLEDIVVSPAARDSTLKGIIHPDDFERLKAESMHENVVAHLAKSGSYSVNYRAYKYGKLINYQTRYTLDKDNPRKIIIGLHSTDPLF